MPCADSGEGYKKHNFQLSSWCQRQKQALLLVYPAPLTEGFHIFAL